jgi:hypothetical protein
MTLYVNKNNQKLGPFTLAQAQRMVATGVLQPVDQAWHEGLPDWLPLQDIPGFSERQAPVPPPPEHERPALVWIISLFYFVSFPISTLSLLVLPLFSFDLIPLKGAQRADFHAMGGVEYSVAWFNLLLTLTWAIQLFRLRRSALPLYSLSMAISILHTTYSIVSENWLNAVAHGGTTVIVGTVIGWILNFVLLGYIWHLWRKGVLN